MIIKLLNEDGTDFNPPKNPLKEKWDKLYPKQDCDTYSCIFCGKCPSGEYWKIPEEDLEIWNKYREEYDSYIKLHNPSMCRKG